MGRGTSGQRHEASRRLHRRGRASRRLGEKMFIAVELYQGRRLCQKRSERRAFQAKESKPTGQRTSKETLQTKRIIPRGKIDLHKEIRAWGMETARVIENAFFLIKKCYIIDCFRQKLWSRATQCRCRSKRETTSSRPGAGTEAHHEEVLRWTGATA